jgi:hypothetical protein
VRLAADWLRNADPPHLYADPPHYNADPPHFNADPDPGVYTGADSCPEVIFLYWEMARHEHIPARFHSIEFKKKNNIYN